MGHKTSHKGIFLETKIYTSSESCINKLSIDVWFVRVEQIQLFENLESEGAKTILRKSPLKLSKLRSLLCILLIKNYVLTVMVGSLQNIFMKHCIYLIS